MQLENEDKSTGIEDVREPRKPPPKKTNKQKNQNNIIETKANRTVWNTCYIPQIYKQRNNNYHNSKNNQRYTLIYCVKIKT